LSISAKKSHKADLRLRSFATAAGHLARGHGHGDKGA
jgi:hypothetical protein